MAKDSGSQSYKHKNPKMAFLGGEKSDHFDSKLILAMFEWFLKVHPFINFEGEGFGRIYRLGLK